MIQNSTQNIIADAAEELLKANSIEDISIQDIVEACGTTRTTFYRYFQDKYDVMNWVYTRGADMIVQNYLESDSVYDMIVELLEYIKSKQKYFHSLTKYNGQNSFHNFFTGYGIEFYEKRIRIKTTSNDIPDKIHALVEGYCFGTGNVVTRWIENDCKKDITDVADIIRELTPPLLISYLF